MSCGRRLKGIAGQPRAGKLGRLLLAVLLRPLVCGHSSSSPVSLSAEGRTITGAVVKSKRNWTVDGSLLLRAGFCHKLGDRRGQRQHGHLGEQQNLDEIR